MQLLLFNFPDSRIPNLGIISDEFGISTTLWFSQSLDFSSPGIFVVDIQGKCQRHIQIHYIAWGNGQQTHTDTHTHVIALESWMPYSLWSIGRQKKDVRLRMTATPPMGTYSCLVFLSLWKWQKQHVEICTEPRKKFSWGWRAIICSFKILSQFFPHQ